MYTLNKNEKDQIYGDSRQDIKIKNVFRGFQVVAQVISP